MRGSQVGLPPLLLHFTVTGPLPPDKAIGPAGHSNYTVRCHRLTVTVPGGIGLTEVLERAGHPSQKDFKPTAAGATTACSSLAAPSPRLAGRDPRQAKPRATVRASRRSKSSRRTRARAPSSPRTTATAWCSPCFAPSASFSIYCTRCSPRANPR